MINRFNLYKFKKKKIWDLLDKIKILYIKNIIINIIKIKRKKL